MSFLDLETQINGLDFENPVMLAAGILGTTGSSLKNVSNHGAGGLVTKTITKPPKKGHNGPVLLEANSSYLNAMGLPNPGASEFIEELKDLKDIKKPIIASVSGEKIEELKEVVSLLNDYVDGFEVNLSCPNVEGGIICKESSLVESYIIGARKETNKPIWAKLSPDIEEIDKKAKVAEKSGANAIVAINTVEGMEIDIKSGRPILSNKKGGISGEAINPIALKCVYDIYKAVEIPVIGVGGVYNWENAIKLIMAGSSAIQIGSGISKGLNIFEEVKKGIIEFLKKEGFNSIDEIKGISHRY
ncbi:MAG: Dihydroorotate dehydrogenase, PyrD [Candidatus Methanohalarchaeum thermophilum]|uniref:Dihydroorotate dehydrogenase n=1 Tax=Methanohalarchaeum thermophilum TaxID=1903181 RepID=A0A1Q6DXH6_METT1|nr:MAG: Dihydroorotate dehydrogenase, PyrD [Candidatus Methanohalarchaeum thermophilum]